MMSNMFSFYIKVWLDMWLTKETKAHLSDKWHDKGHPSIVPTDKF
jgi:hypothetical protein